jgi:hypothetical protein
MDVCTKVENCMRCPLGYVDRLDDPRCGYYDRGIEDHLLPADEKPEWCKVTQVIIEGED